MSPARETTDGREILLLFDGNNLVYRSFFAISSLANRDGFPTNAVYGFTNVLRKILSDETPGLAAVTFDAGGKTFRHERFEDYKANRAPTPPDLIQQLPYARKLCDALGLPRLEIEGVEADDIIGTLTTMGVEAGYDVLIVTSDKDLLQLVGDGVTVIHPVKYDRLDPAGVEAKMGVPPEQVVDLLALKGDSIDNIPGVPGIGDKGAAKLLAEWGTLEELLAHASEIRNKRQREALLEHADDARVSKELVTIVTDLDLDVDFESLRYRGANREETFALFKELGFSTLLKDYLPAAEPEDLSASFDAVESEAGLARLVESARKRGRVSVWLELTETRRFDPWHAGLRGVGLATETGAAHYVVAGSGISEEVLTTAMGELLADESVEKVGYDLKRYATFFGARGVRMAGRLFDTRIAAYVLNPSRRSQALDDLMVEFLQKALSKEAEASPTQAMLPGLEPEGGAESGVLYAERAERMLRLEDKMARRLAEDDLEELFETLEMPLVEVLATMELAGIAIDAEEFVLMSRELAGQLDELTGEIYELAGVEFNVNSPKQIREILFEKQNLPAFKKTQKQRAASTSVDVLEELAASFPLPRKILDYRSLAKLKGTYIDALPKLVHPTSHRLHTTFNQTVTATGRLSSSDPNLQNIPIRTDLGRRLRRAFVAEPGSLLLSADYSQIELRVLAHLSGDPTLVSAFRNDEDIHDRTARQMFGEESELSSHERRRRAKIINFSIIYGKTAFTLAKDFGVSTREAQEFIDAYFERHPGVRDLLDQIIRDTRTTGKVRTLFGRQRYVPEIASRNRSTRSAAERVAVNTPVQGTAADLIKKAMVDLHRRLRDEERRSRLLLQVHDELVLEVPEEELDDATSLVRDTMENVYPMEVPLKVDMKVGRSWEH